MCVADRDRRLEGISREPSRSEISIHKPEDMDFVAALVQQVSAWLKVSGCPSAGVTEQPNASRTIASEGHTICVVYTCFASSVDLCWFCVQGSQHLLKGTRIKRR